MAYTYTTSTGGAIGFVQVAAATPQTASAPVAVTYPGAQTAGNLNVVVVGWNDTTSTVTVGDGQSGEQLHPGDRTDERDRVAAVDLLREEHRGGQQYGDGDVQPGGGVRRRTGAGVQRVGHGDAAGCDGGSEREQGEREQRGGDDDVGERVDLRSGDDGGDVWRIGGRDL